MKFGGMGLVALGLLIALSVNGGCSGAAPVRPQGADSFGGPLTRSVTAVHPGQLDVKNRFLPAVSVRTPSKRIDGQSDCSGVIVSPRLVVTAGHCVCKKRQLVRVDAANVSKSIEKAFVSRSREGRETLSKELLEEAVTVIDSSDCVESTVVSVTTYSAQPSRRQAAEGPDLSYSVREYRGEVRPHEDLMILYDENQWTVFKEVDLAAVILRKPIQGVSPIVRLAKSEIQSGDLVVMAGYGLGDEEANAKEYGDRYVGESQVVRVVRSESGNVQFLTGGTLPTGGVASRVHGGDSGAPCFRKADKGELLGVASAYTEDEEGNTLSIFTSIYPHRDWLKKMMAIAEAAPR